MILVIGAGIGGLTTAIALRRAGIDVAVYERASELREVGAGLSIWKNALVALDTIGLGDEIRRFGQPYLNAGLRRSDGRVLVSPSLERLTAKFGEVAVVLPRAAVQRVLVEALGREHIHLGKACTAIAHHGDEVNAIFADGTRAHGAGLVGADGLHSVVRASLHGSQAPAYTGYTAWRAVTSFDHAKLASGETWGRGSRFGQVPMANGQVYWFATCNTAAGGRSSDGEKAECRRLFQNWHDPIPALVESTPPQAILRNDIYDRPTLESWSVGRVTLLGDAAHPMAPNLGQGGCQAIEDAVVLARVLKESDDVAHAWRRYEALRLPRTSRIVAASRQIGAMAQWTNPAAIWLRNTLVSWLAPHLMVRQMSDVIGFDPTCRSSSRGAP